MSDNRLADEAAYFGAVQDGIDSQQDAIERLRADFSDVCEKLAKENAANLKLQAENAHPAQLQGEVFAAIETNGSCRRAGRTA